jgi:hypothetical protein
VATFVPGRPWPYLGVLRPAAPFTTGGRRPFLGARRPVAAFTPGGLRPFFGIRRLAALGAREFIPVFDSSGWLPIFDLLRLVLVLSVGSVSLLSPPPASAQPTVPAPGPEFTREEGHATVEGAETGPFYRPGFVAGYQWEEAGVRDDGSTRPADFHPVAPPPGKDLVWQPGHVGPDRFFVLGFWRQKQAAGYKWAEGRYDRGLWLEGDFAPEGQPPNAGLTWSPGHVGSDRRFVLGFWRPATLNGHKWVEGYYLRDQWIEGFMRPDAPPPPGMVFEYGHVGEARVWQLGFLRPASVKGFHWVEGRYDGDAWTEGDFKPDETRSGSAWEPGHRDPKTGQWVMGFWRPESKPGQEWVPGRASGGKWTAGKWVREVKPRDRPKDQAPAADKPPIRREGP